MDLLRVQFHNVAPNEPSRRPIRGEDRSNPKISRGCRVDAAPCSLKPQAVGSIKVQPNPVLLVELQTNVIPGSLFLDRYSTAERNLLEHYQEAAQRPNPVCHLPADLRHGHSP